MNNQLHYQLKALREIINPSFARRVHIHWQIGQTLNSIYKLLLNSSVGEEKEMIESLIAPIEIEDRKSYSVAPEDALRLCDQLISIVMGRMDKPSSMSEISTEKPQRVIPNTRNVFIIHGHDTTNTLRLRNIVKERYNLSPIILTEKPGMGRTLIEKFEEEAKGASYAFALLTPDDLVQVQDKIYAQARPNVVFEVGWFYGRLGRNRACILFKEGAAIHSDLDGILRIQFQEFVDEKVPEIESELKAAGLL